MQKKVIHQNSQSLAVHYASTVAKIPVMMEAHSQVVAAALEVVLPDESAEAEAVLLESVVVLLASMVDIGVGVGGTGVGEDCGQTVGQNLGHSGSAASFYSYPLLPTVYCVKIRSTSFLKLK